MGARKVPFCRRERWALCDLLAELGPDVPTLCEGWRSADLAAHLVARERRLDATPGLSLSVPLLKTWATRVQRGIRDGATWEGLLDKVRSGPPLPLRPFDPWVNSLEFFVHHEDLRRAQEHWEPRELSSADEAVLWRQLKFVARRARRSGVTRLEAPGHPPIAVPKGGSGRGTVVRGPVGEVTLWVFRRRSVARAELSQ